MDKPLYTMAEAAKLLHISRGDIYKLYHAGFLRCLKLGSLKVRKEEIERFMKDAEGKEINLRAISEVSSRRIEKAPR